MEQFSIQPVNGKTQEQAKSIVLEGFKEHFGELDLTLNQDLNGIVRNYLLNGDTFITGFVNHRMVATGALVKEAPGTGRIVRMSVLKAFRRKGYAGKILMKLEEDARKRGFSEVVLETNRDWTGVIHFYLANGFQPEDQNETQMYLMKSI